jgi:hypothetical protein
VVGWPRLPVVPGVPGRARPAPERERGERAPITYSDGMHGFGRLGLSGVPVLPALLCVVLLAGCGQDGADEDRAASDPAAGSTPSEPADGGTATPSAPAADPDAPDCAEVWVTGGPIPRSYAGCNDGDSFVERQALGCSSGQRLVTFDDRWYGVVGGLVREGTTPLEQDREYRASVASCRA